MQFQLPHPTFDIKTYPIAQREIKRQDISIEKPTKKQMQEFQKIREEIANNEIPNKLIRKKLPQNLGYGIFLRPEAKPIKKGQIIGVYSGNGQIRPQNEISTSDYIFALISDIILDKEEQRTFDPKAKYHPKRLYSLEVDAEKKGNFTRYINHSAKPNVEALFFKMPKGNPIEVVYVAKKLIQPKEQLLVSYEGDGDSYWEAMNIEPLPITPKTFQLTEKLTITPKKLT